MEQDHDNIDIADVRSAADAIARYLDDHPDSADTLEGVAEWWLARQRAKDAIAVVGKALESLAKEGKIRKRQSPDGRPIYSSLPTEPSD